MIKNCHECWEKECWPAKPLTTSDLPKLSCQKSWEQIWEKWTSRFVVVLNTLRLHCWKGHSYWSHHSHEKYFTSSLTVSDNRPQYSSERVFQNPWEKINVDSSPRYPQAMGRLNVQWKLIKVCWRRRWPIPGVVIIQSRTLADRIEPVGTACGLQPQSFENNSSLKFQTVHLSMRETSSKHRYIREYLTCVTQLGSYQS